MASGVFYHMSSYPAGSLVQVMATFTDPVTNDNIDPTVVTLYFEDGAGTITTKVYGSDAGFITRQSEGVYTANLDTTPTDPTNIGVWTYQYRGSGGVGQSLKSSTFVVTAPAIPLS
jgi:hypothetical protein